MRASIAGNCGETSHFISPQGCVEDKGGPLGVGLQELISNHLKLLWRVKGFDHKPRGVK
jgi:hypothetical protein